MALESCFLLSVSQLLPVAAPEQTPGFSLTSNLQPLWQWQENPSHALRLSNPYLTTALHSLIFPRNLEILPTHLESLGLYLYF